MGEASPPCPASMLAAWSLRRSPATLAACRLQVTDAREGRGRDRSITNIVANLWKIQEAGVLKDDNEIGKESKLEVNSGVDDILERYKFLTNEKGNEVLRKKKSREILTEKEKMKPELDDELMNRVDAILEKYKVL